MFCPFGPYISLASDAVNAAGVWYNSLAADSRTVDVHIRRLREKIGDTGCKYIKTVRGIGYVFRSNLNKKS